MNPVVMLTILVSLSAAFAWSANRRWQLLKVGRPENRLDDVIERLKGTYEYAFVQKKMNYYPLAGLAHKLIFVGFGVLLLRSMMLWGRGFDPAFNFWILGDRPLFGVIPLGHIYEFIKDTVALLVIFGALVFLYYRLVKHEARMTLSGEGVLILGIIVAMMGADILYDGASLVLWHRYAETPCTDAEVCARVRTLTAHARSPRTSPARPRARSAGAPTRRRPDPWPRASSRAPAPRTSSCSRTSASGRTRRWSCSS
jgi:hypothetical protein